MATQICKQCGKEFQAIPSAKRKFCSYGCAYKNKDRINATSDKLRKDRGTSKCAGCGQEFKLHTRSGRGKYCSQKCAASNIGKVTLAKNRIQQPKTKEIAKKCEDCGKEFLSWVANHRKYCSMKCSGKGTALKRTETMHKNGWYMAANCFSRAKRGPRPDIGITVRSSWEANYARYLNFLIKHEGKILKWEYEVETFWFEKIKRGVRSYKPDFKVTFRSGEIEYHEVKGWMYPRAKTALNRMRIYHPRIKIVLIGEKSYEAIQKQAGSMIPLWEFPAKAKYTPRKRSKKYKKRPK